MDTPIKHKIVILLLLDVITEQYRMQFDDKKKIKLIVGRRCRQYQTNYFIKCINNFTNLILFILFIKKVIVVIFIHIYYDLTFIKS